MSDPVILHCDCNGFYASVEQLKRPELKAVPMAVCGDPESRHGIILAKNELAKGFGLASANFYVEEIDGGIRFVCLGKGNGLGVSQYGANRMAMDGKNMEEIIKYYLQKVSIENYRDN